jgi:hypothetical protein
MMQRYPVIRVLVVGWSILTAPLCPYAQTEEHFTDLRQRSYYTTAAPDTASQNRRGPQCHLRVQLGHHPPTVLSRPGQARGGAGTVSPDIHRD